MLFFEMIYIEVYIYLDVNDPTKVIKIYHPKNNRKVYLKASSWPMDFLVTWGVSETLHVTKNRHLPKYPNLTFLLSGDMKSFTNSSCHQEVHRSWRSVYYLAQLPLWCLGFVLWWRGRRKGSISYWSIINII